jgi:hypothetical protein
LRAWSSATEGIVKKEAFERDERLVEFEGDEGDPGEAV